MKAGWTKPKYCELRPQIDGVGGSGCGLFRPTQFGVGALNQSKILVTTPTNVNNIYWVLFDFAACRIQADIDSFRYKQKFEFFQPSFHWETWKDIMKAEYNKFAISQITRIGASCKPSY